MELVVEADTDVCDEWPLEPLAPLLGSLGTRCPCASMDLSRSNC